MFCRSEPVLLTMSCKAGGWDKVACLFFVLFFNLLRAETAKRTASAVYSSESYFRLMTGDAGWWGAVESPSDIQPLPDPSCAFRATSGICTSGGGRTHHAHGPQTAACWRDNRISQQQHGRRRAERRDVNELKVSAGAIPPNCACLSQTG